MFFSIFAILVMDLTKHEWIHTSPTEDLEIWVGNGEAIWYKEVPEKVRAAKSLGNEISTSLHLFASRLLLDPLKMCCVLDAFLLLLCVQRDCQLTVSTAS
jgi:hypothetical protein